MLVSNLGRKWAGDRPYGQEQGVKILRSFGSLHFPPPDGYAILNSLIAGVAVLNPDGTIVFTNEAWDRLAEENGNPPLSAVSCGANYFEVCIQAVLDGAPRAEASLSGIKDILEGKRIWFSVDYPWDSSSGPRWFTMAVTPVKGAKGVAVTSYLDVTRSQRADIDQEWLRHQQQIRALLDIAPDTVVRLDREGRYAYVNAMTAKFVGLPPQEFQGKTPREVGLPEDLCDQWVRTMGNLCVTGQPQFIEMSYPLHPEIIWEERATAEFAKDGTVESMLIIGRDITERKRLEAAAEAQAIQIRALAARLLAVEEEERRRIARELHDNLLQQLAFLAVETKGLIAKIPPPDVARERLRAIQSRVVKVSEEVRYISYKLHPAILDDLGLVVALNALCDEFAVQQPINVKFTHRRTPLTIPLDVASCLYRVVQESLNNVAKYAHAKTVTLKLLVRGQHLRLSVTDDGVGFDTSAVKGKARLGLVSMEERVTLIGGQFEIESRPGDGTRISVIAPLPH